MGSHIAYTANKIFTGTTWLTDHAVLVKDGFIHKVSPVNEIPSDIHLQPLAESMIAPAFIDLQIYGAQEKLLSQYPQADSLVALHDYCVKGGAAYCLPTVATHSIDVFRRSIDAIREYWRMGGLGVLGIHLEGPWINPLKKGAHMEAYIHAPTMQEVEDLLEYGKGVIKMITLAPEQCDAAIIQRISDEGIIVSAGHSDARYEEAKKSFKEGVKAVTHLYNAMSSLQHRAAGLVGAAMDDDHVMASIIPDGYHVDYSALRIAKAVMKERLFVITDAVTSTDEGPYQHILEDDKYATGGILSGSALTMFKAFMNLVEHCGIEMGEAIRMCSVYPAKLIGMETQIGSIEKGCRANMIAIDMKQGTCRMI